MSRLISCPPVTVVLADSCAATRAEFKSILAAHADIRVIGQAVVSNGLKTVVAELQPDVVVLDISLRSRTQAGRPLEIVRQFSSAKVLLISPWNHPLYVARFLEAGARGYLLKTNAYDELAPAIRIAILGGLFLSPELGNPMQAWQSSRWSISDVQMTLPESS